MTYSLKLKSSQRLRRALCYIAILLLSACLFACSKSDEGVAANSFVGNWYLSSYMEDVNGNRINDDPKMQLQSYESCSMKFTKDGKLQVHTQRDQSIVYDLTYDWSVTSDSRVILYLTATTPMGTNSYNIEVAAISNNTLVLVHGQNSTAEALRFVPPHAFSTNWLIFTRQ
jgi:outer membrane biogenesis lipoprotein LolB